jgi:hypothetical protein
MLERDVPELTLRVGPVEQIGKSHLASRECITGILGGTDEAISVGREYINVNIDKGYHRVSRR